MRRTEDCYADLAQVYDSFVGRRPEILRLQKLIRAYAPKAGTVLELACGTGAILEALSVEYEVSGIDLSRPMLMRARAKIAHGRFECQDMRSFELKQSFDVVLCVFNSLNHLSRFRDWEQTFAAAARHLRPGGLFLFDINTERGLRSYAAEGLRLEEEDERVMITRFSLVRGGALELRIKVFERSAGPVYRLHQAVILERAFETARIRSALQRHFSPITVLDFDRVKPSAASEELYFLCQKHS